MKFIVLPKVFHFETLDLVFPSILSRVPFELLKGKIPSDGGWFQVSRNDVVITYQSCGRKYESYMMSSQTVVLSMICE